MRRPSSLAVRTTALCLAVAGVMALVAGGVSVRLVGTTSREISQQTLAAEADVVAAQLAESRLGARRLNEILQGQGVEVVRRGATGGLAGVDETAVEAARRAGLAEVSAEVPLHGTARVNGSTLLVEGRTVEGDIAIALVGRVATAEGSGRRLLNNVVFALGIGLLVAAGAGSLLARRLAGPLRRTAAVASAMSHGRRDLRVPPEGPRELVEVGESINTLANALAYSEARQREFLLSVSHELRTPLTAVTGFAESLADGVVTGAEVPEVGRVIGQEAERLNRLVSDLLDLARLGADDFRLDIADVDLTALLAESAQVWHARCAAAGVAFSLVAPLAPGTGPGRPAAAAPGGGRPGGERAAGDAGGVADRAGPATRPGRGGHRGPRRRPGPGGGGLRAGVRAGRVAFAVRGRPAGGDRPRAGSRARAGDPHGRTDRGGTGTGGWRPIHGVVADGTAGGRDPTVARRLAPGTQTTDGPKFEKYLRSVTGESR